MNPTKANEREDDNNNDKKPAASPAPQLEKLKNATKVDDKNISTPQGFFFGRGAPNANNPENMKMRGMVAAEFDRYKAAGTQKERKTIVADIVKNLKKGCSRFLEKQDENSEWTEVTDDSKIFDAVRQRFYCLTLIKRRQESKVNGGALLHSSMLKIFNEKEQAKEKWYESNKGKPSNEDLIPLLPQNAETRRAAFALLQQNQKAATSSKKKHKTPRDKSDKTTSRPCKKQKMDHESPTAAAFPIQAPPTPVAAKEATTMVKMQIESSIVAATVPAQDPSTPATTPKTLAMVGTTPLELGRGVATVSPAYSMAGGGALNFAAAVNAPPVQKQEYFSLGRALRKPDLYSETESTQRQSPKKTSAIGPFQSPIDVVLAGINCPSPQSPTKTKKRSTVFSPLQSPSDCSSLDYMSPQPPTKRKWVLSPRYSPPQIDMFGGIMSRSMSSDSLMEECSLHGYPAFHRNHYNQDELENE